jgi:hypothetical protein
MTMSEQLTLDGSPARLARRMTSRQRDLWLWIAFEPDATISTVVARRFFRDASGALRRMEQLGVVEQVKRGKWRAI